MENTLKPYTPLPKYAQQTANLAKKNPALYKETFHFHLQHVLLKVQIDVPINSADPPL